jgi:hypothetical protein
MIGGRVIGCAYSTDGETVLLNVEGSGDQAGQEFAVRVQVRIGCEVTPGDLLWWHGDAVLWTPEFRVLPPDNPKSGIHYDVSLQRVEL